MGQAFLIFLVAHAVISMLALHLSPVDVRADFRLKKTPIPDSIALKALSNQVDLEEYGLSGCQLLAWNGDESISLDDRMVEVRCVEREVDHALYGSTPLRSIRQHLEQSPEWELESYSFSVINRGDKLISGWLYAVLAVIAIFLLRDLDIRSDMRLALRSLYVKPWILVICPAASFLVFGLISLLAPPSMERLQPAVEVFEALVPSVWVIVIILPFFEETLFRQWAYVRCINNFKPITVALGTSWFFMLAHILNPQVLAVPAFLPTVFVAGFSLFWIRHRFQSFSLTFFAHAVHNGLVLFLGGWLGESVGG